MSIPKPPDTSQDQELFANMLMALQGVTVLAEPRVSRDTMLEVLREHTTMLKSCRSEVATIGSIVRSLASEAADNRRVLQNLQEDCKSNKKEIDSLFRISENYRLELDDIGRKLAELFLLKEVVEGHGNELNALKDNLNNYKNEMKISLGETNDAVSLLDHKNNETQFQLKELRHYVDHFGDNLILASNQITVESSAGFSTRPLSLLQVLTQTNGVIHDIECNIEENTKNILSNTSSIDMKADNTILFNVDTLETKVKAIEAHLKREEEQGISAIRKTTETLTEAVDQIQFQLMDKVGQEAVDSIVHKKYEDIVEYLKDALSSSAEDENNFKQKAEEMNEMVSKLSANKADRIELTAIQEIAVRAESMLTKLGCNTKGPKDFYIKKEIEAMLELKVDKQDFESQIQSVVKGRKKKLGALSMSGGPSEAAIIDESLVNTNVLLSGTNTTSEIAMWKGLANVMKEESDQALARAVTPGRALPLTGAATTSDFGNYMKTKKMDTKIRPNMAASKIDTRNNSPTNIRPESPASLGGYAGDYGQPGGPSYSVASLGGSISEIISKNQQGFPHVPPGAEGHIPDTNFIGGAHVGSGFNFRGVQAPLKSYQALQPLSGTVNQVDVEGNGLMVKGADGKFYYQDISQEELEKLKKQATLSNSKPSAVKKVLNTH